MEIGVVVHGPGIIDSGYALKIINLLSTYGNVRCRLGGTMGRTAVIDAGLEERIDISLKLLPSESLEFFNRENMDVIFLLNYGKSSLTGQVFGYKTFTHYFKKISDEDYLATNHKSLYDSKIPVIQIERPGEEDGSIISWNVVLNKQLANSKKRRFGFSKRDMVDALHFNFEELYYGIAEELNLNSVDPEEIVSKYFSQNIESYDENHIQRIIHSYSNYDESKNYTYRKIHGASPDENIFLNGIVVGYARSEEVIIIAEDGLIIDILGGEIKDHGVEKLGPVNLKNVIVKTGLLRKSEDVTPRILEKEKVYVEDSERNLYSNGVSDDDSSFRVGFVDHAAYDIYRFKDFDLVITIGDDTTLVASDILYRFNIPIIGITDGDLDKVVEKGFVNEKSSIIEVAPGFDDIVGHNILDEIFESNQILEIPYNEEYDSVEEFKAVMMAIIKSHVLGSVKEIVPSFIEKNHAYEEVYVYSLLDEESDYDFQVVHGDNDDLEYIEFLDESFEFVETRDGISEFAKSLDDDSDAAEVIDEVSGSVDPLDEVSNFAEVKNDDSDLVKAQDSSFDLVEAQDNNSDDVESSENLSALSGEKTISDILNAEETSTPIINEDEISAVVIDKEETETAVIDKEEAGTDSLEEELEEEFIYVDSDGNEVVFEEGVVYVDSDGNEVVFEEEVVYVDSEGNEVVFEEDKILSSDGENLNEELLEKYNDLIGDYVNEFEESLDDEFSKVYDEKTSDDPNDEELLEDNSKENNPKDEMSFRG
ncbi:MAG: DUF2117 domain-containing protein [Methanobrevibacter sp.]|nr:DUF2117 domain-containing protein [Methanobrevibacter sp.]